MLTLKYLMERFTRSHIFTGHTASLAADSVRNWLASERVPLFLAVLAVALTAQSVTVGLQWDDYLQREILLKRADWAIQDHSLTGMFSFFNGDPKLAKHQMDIGIAPWWTYEGIRWSFYRPLAEMTHWLDYHLWPDSPKLMHVQNLLWFGIMVFAAALLYRKIVDPAWVAGLAAFLFAVDDSHAVPVTWLANRNALMATAFGIIALIAHDRWRRQNWKAGSVIGPICLLLGLLSAEAAIAAGAYLLSYELFLVRCGITRKISGLLPYAVVSVVWWFTYHRLGFGAVGSGSYIDPGQEPLLFLSALIERIPILLFGQWFFHSLVWYGALPASLVPLAWIIVSIFLAAVAALMLPLLKRDRVSRFWALGMMLSLFPICSVFPENRLLLFVGLGAMGLLAQFLSVWFDRADWLPTSVTWRYVAALFIFIFVFVRVVVSPIQLAKASQSIKDYSEKPYLQLPGEHTIANKNVVFVNPPFSFFILHMRYIREEYGSRPAAHMRPLTSGLPPHLYIKRLDERSLEVQPDDGFLAANVDKLFRGPNHPMRVGQRVELPDMTVEVLSLTADKRPQRAKFTFPVALDDPSLLFLEWKTDGYVPFKLPAVGKSVRLSWSTIFGGRSVKQD